MINIKEMILVCGALMGATLCAAELPTAECLWYTRPAPVRAKSLPWEPQGKGAENPGVWESQTLPVGNGRIGGTNYGGPGLDCVTLNEVSLWSGGPNLGNNGSGYNYGPKAGKDAFGSYQPFANLYVEYDGCATVSNYKRWLALDEAIHRTELQDANGNKQKRECFVSKPNDVLVYHVEGEKAGSISAQVALLPFHSVSYSKQGDDTICMRGTLANGENFEGRILVRTEGGSATIERSGAKLNVEYEGGQNNVMPTYDASTVPYIRISQANSFTLFITLATDYKMSYSAHWKGADPAKHNQKVLKKIRKKTLQDIREAHLADHRALYRRLSISLGKTAPEISALPTNERLQRYKNGQQDPELEATVYQYGRYMLIAGSRPGNLPLNLQGIWNNRVHAPWACDYHNNINLQMCYWGAEVGNLSECHQPLIDFIAAMQQPLHEMTQKEFGNNIRGWTTRISQNPWGGGGWVKWNPPVNAWYALHIWDHYLFTQDKEYLKKTAYPILKNICQFWEDSLKVLGNEGAGLQSDGKPLTAADHPELKEIKKGALVSPKGWSHEWGPVEDGCMHDQQLVWELFDLTAQAAKVLKTDAAYARTLAEKKSRLVPNRIGSGGYLQEWIVDRPNMVSGHRHTSHLIGVYPGSSISKARTPELAAAAMKSLELRGLSGDNRRSWTWPWRTALWARFGEAEKAYDMVRNYLTHNVLDNLFGNHPPMQLDGTYGMTGGISEMLVQSHAGQLELLPALPQAWANGFVKGIKARGGITIDMEWKNGKLTQLTLYKADGDQNPISVTSQGESITITPTAAK